MQIHCGIHAACPHNFVMCTPISTQRLKLTAPSIACFCALHLTGPSAQHGGQPQSAAACRRKHGNGSQWLAMLCCLCMLKKAHWVLQALLQDVQEGASSTELGNHGWGLEADAQEQDHVGVAQGRHEAGLLAQLLQQHRVVLGHIPAKRSLSAPYLSLMFSLITLWGHWIVIIALSCSPCFRAGSCFCTCSLCSMHQELSCRRMDRTPSGGLFMLNQALRRSLLRLCWSNKVCQGTVQRVGT